MRPVSSCLGLCLREESFPRVSPHTGPHVLAETARSEFPNCEPLSQFWMNVFLLIRVRLEHCPVANGVQKLRRRCAQFIQFRIFANSLIESSFGNISICWQNQSSKANIAPSFFSFLSLLSTYAIFRSELRKVFVHPSLQVCESTQRRCYAIHFFVAVVVVVVA